MTYNNSSNHHTFYQVLGVDPNATQSEIKKMYQKLALKVLKVHHD